MSKRDKPLRLRRPSKKGVAKSRKPARADSLIPSRDSHTDVKRWRGVVSSAPRTEAFERRQDSFVDSQRSHVRVFKAPPEVVRGKLKYEAKRKSQVTHARRDAQTGKFISEHRMQALREAREVAKTRRTKLARIPG